MIPVNYLLIFFTILFTAKIPQIVAERCESNYTVRLNNFPLLITPTECPISETDFSMDAANKVGLLLEDGACVGKDYNKNIVPFTEGFMESGKTVHQELQKQGWICPAKTLKWKGTGKRTCKTPITLVYTKIQNYMVRDINDKKRTVTLDVSLALMWMDHGIKTYKPTNAQQQRLGKIGLPQERIESIWKPDIHIYALAEYKTYRLSYSTDSLNIVSFDVLTSNHLDPTNGFCLYGPMIRCEMEAKIIFYCNFDYSAYPMDESTCKFRFGGQRANLRFTLEKPDNITPIDEKKHHIGYFDITGSIIEETEMINEKKMQRLGLDLKIKRNIQPFILRYYLPCATITIVSQFSFLIPFTALPGRVALLVTQFLTLTSLFIHQMVCTNQTYWGRRVNI